VFGKIESLTPLSFEPKLDIFQNPLKFTYITKTSNRDRKWA
jgi:hypothetical protein